MVSFLILALLINVECYVSLVLVFISRVINDVEHLLMWSFAHLPSVCLSFFNKMPKCFALFHSIGSLLFLSLSFVRSSHILDAFILYLYCKYLLIASDRCFLSLEGIFGKVDFFQVYSFLRERNRP